MGRMKGDSTTHVYSKKGAINHDNIQWSSNKTGCEHRRSIGKGRSLCLKNAVRNCTKVEECPVRGNCHV